MMKPNAWTPRELETLRLEFPVRETKDVAEMIGRSYQATAVMASKLGLKKRHYGIVWTPQMLKILTDFYPIMFDAPLAKWVGVSKRSLIRKARKLGLEKEPGFLEKRRRDIQELAREGLRRTSRTSTRFKKGERSNPAGEFKKGHRLTPEQEAKRIASLKYSWEVRRRKEELRKHGIKI